MTSVPHATLENGATLEKEQLGKDLLTPPGSVSGILSVTTRICRREERKHVDISGKDKSD